MISVYHGETENGIDPLDVEAIGPYMLMIQWGREHPSAFIEKVFGVPLLDYQKLIIEKTWRATVAVWLMTRNGGKSFLVGLFMAARGLLFPNQDIQICNKTARQANETFAQLEKFAKNQIASVVSNNTVFLNELDRNNNDGFTHDDKKGHECHLMNGSVIHSVAGTADSIRGKRATLLVFDEAGFVKHEIYEVAEKFQLQTAEFKTGASIDIAIYPPEIPNLTLYIGSASDTGSDFYKKLKRCAEKMLAGDDSYYAADIDCEVPLAPQMNGVDYPPLFARAKVEQAESENPLNAFREFHNHFDNFDTNNAVVTMSDIKDNEKVYEPVLRWGGKKHKYVLCWDPAAKNDNTPLLVGEVLKDENGNIRGRYVHMENLIKRYADGSLCPMTTEEQVSRIRDLIYEYNGRDNVAPYENITFLMDSGSGGQPYPAAQLLMKDWTDSFGNKHPGLYDKNDEASRHWQEQCPHAVPGHMLLLSPKKVRNDMFVAAKTLVPMGVLDFPINVSDSTDIIVPEVGREDHIGKPQHLGDEERASLHQMELMKVEMASMVSTKSATTGNITYSLPPEKQNIAYDDRNYVAIMFAWWIQQLRQGLQSDVSELDYATNYIQRVMKKSDPLQNPTPLSPQDPEDPWAKYAASVVAGFNRGASKGSSPFTGQNPFASKK